MIDLAISKFGSKRVKRIHTHGMMVKFSASHKAVIFVNNEGQITVQARAGENKTDRPATPIEAIALIENIPQLPVNTKNSVNATSLMALLINQNYKCAMTGRELSPENCELDHILPISMGGEHEIDNVQFLTKEANRAKGAMSVHEFVELCKEVAQNVAKAVKHPQAKTVKDPHSKGTSGRFAQIRY